MNRQLPVQDPTDQGSLADQTAAYVRNHPLLRMVLALTVLNHVAAILLTLCRVLQTEVAGLLVLLSVLTWFFGVGLPVLNREVRHRMGAGRDSYWGEVTEAFARVVLCAQTGLYSAALLFYSLAPL